MLRTHIVTLYNWTPGVEEDAYGKTVDGWELAEDDVQVNLQALTGSVAQTAAGRAIESSYRLFGPGHVVFQPDQGVVVKEILPAGDPYMGPIRFRIQQVGSQGGKWDAEVFLKDTQEKIP